MCVTERNHCYNVINVKHPTVWLAQQVTIDVRNFPLRHLLEDLGTAQAWVQPPGRQAQWAIYEIGGNQISLAG